MGTPLLMGAGTFKSYDADAQLYFNQLSPQPSSVYKNAINTLILQLKADGNWAELDRLWIFGTEFQQNATISVVNPTSTAITEVGTPLWTVNYGYTSIGAASYLNSNYNVLTSSVKYTQDSASFGVYSTSNAAVATVGMGWEKSAPPTGAYIFPRHTIGSMIAEINNNGGGVIAVADSLALFSMSRSVNTTMKFYKRGVLINTDSAGYAASVALQSLNFFILAENLDGGPLLADISRQYSLAFIGSGAINQTTFYSAIQAFATTIQFNV